MLIVPNSSPQSRRSSASFKPGDLVTGKDRSYKRSIYKMLSTSENPETGLFEFQSLGPYCVDRYIDMGSKSVQYQFIREYAEFRLANRQEIAVSNRTRSQYRMLKFLERLGILDNYRNYV